MAHFIMKTHTEYGNIRITDGTTIETKDLFSDSSRQGMIFLHGLGGSARVEDALTNKLAENNHVITFSPRNSGGSNGHYTIDKYVSDAREFIQHAKQKLGDNIIGIGMSTGAYVLAQVLGEEEEAVDKAIFISPLMRMSENIPYVLDKYFKHCINSGINPFHLKNFRIGEQRFNDGDSLEYLKSVYNAPACTKPIKKPSIALMPRGNEFRLPVSMQVLESRMNNWEKLGTKVSLFPKTNHYFSGKWYNGLGEFYSELVQPEQFSIISDFVKN